MKQLEWALKEHYPTIGKGIFGAPLRFGDPHSRTPWLHHDLPYEEKSYTPPKKRKRKKEGKKPKKKTKQKHQYKKGGSNTKTKKKKKGKLFLPGGGSRSGWYQGKKKMLQNTFFRLERKKLGGKSRSYYIK